MMNLDCAPAGSIRFLLVAGGLLGASFASAPNAYSEDVVTECINANEDSLTLRKQGKLLDARRALAACAASTCPDAIQQACRSRIAEINNAIPTVVFDVKDAEGRDQMDAKVSVDGQPMAAVGLTAIPLDPGRHVLRFEAAGQPPYERDLVVREGQKEQRVAVVLGGARALVPTPAPSPAPSEATSLPPKEAPAPVDAVEAAAEATKTSPSTEQPPTAGTGQRTVGWILGGTGIAAMGAGVALGLVAKSSYYGAAGCSGSICTSRSGFDTQNSARGLGNIGTGIFAAGAALTATGVIVWITAPRGSVTGGDPPLRVALTSAGMVVKGIF
ncbi:MAG: hypothetical protein ABSC94_12435 [Polyangiaceae bacterium]|jgi:hypothetical protein